MEARARRAAHCGSTVPHRPGLQYEDSFDSLGDSPHSDRWEGNRPLSVVMALGHILVPTLGGLVLQLALYRPLEASEGTLKESMANTTLP